MSTKKGREIRTLMQSKFLMEAIKEAKRALKIKEVPVGAVIVRDGFIVAKAHNLKETLIDVTAHAEMLAIKKASEELGTWRLSDCDMYVTLEPCPMCAAVIAQSRIKNLYIGTFDPVAGACGSVINLISNEYLNYRVNVQWMYDEECSLILQRFFKGRREAR